MSKNGLKFMDSDMHVIEPVDLWQRYIDPEYMERAPVGMARYQQDLCVEIDGEQIPRDVHDDLFEEKAGPLDAYQDPIDSGWDPGSQVRAMDREGMDMALMYPSRGLFAVATDKLDAGFGAAIARAYNDWMSDFCSPFPDRMKGIGMVFPTDVGEAVKEVKRCVEELGFRGVFLRPNLYLGRNWHDPYYDPLWEQIEALDAAVGFHEGSHVPMPEAGSQFEGDYWLFHTCCHSMEMMMAAVSMIGGGVLERFPSLRVAFLEANCSWVPWLMWRLDDHFEFSGKMEAPGLTMTPGDYFKRQCYVSVEPEESPAAMVESYGLDDNLVLSTDYPHPDSKFPHAVDLFMELPLSGSMRRKTMWDNCARLYGIT